MLTPQLPTPSLLLPGSAQPTHPECHCTRLHMSCPHPSFSAGASEALRDFCTGVIALDLGGLRSLLDKGSP